MKRTGGFVRIASTRSRSGTQLFQVSTHVALAGRPGAYSRRRTFAFINESWVAQALCAQTDPDAFFPENGGSSRAAKKVCVGCDVRSECLEYAVAHDERFGVWGGLSERERRKLQRLQRARLA